MKLKLSSTDLGAHHREKRYSTIVDYILSYQLDNVETNTARLGHTFIVVAKTQIIALLLVISYQHIIENALSDKIYQVVNLISMTLMANPIKVLSSQENFYWRFFRVLWDSLSSYLIY
jgi:hypothetical protein